MKRKKRGYLLDLDSDKKKKLYKLIRERPQQVSNFKELARLMRKDGQFESAKKVLRQGIRTHPDHKPMHSHLAKTYYEGGEPRKALRAYKTLIENYPEEWVFYEKLDKLCREHDLINHAIHVYQAVDKKNKYKKHSYQRAHFLLIEKLKDIDRGIDNLLDAIKNVGPSYRFCKNLGRLYGKRQEWKKAARYFKKALEFKPDDSDLISLLAWALVDSGKLKEAERYFLKIRDTFQGMVSLAELYLRLDRLDEAEKQLKIAAKNYPNNSRIDTDFADLHLRRGEIEEARDLAESSLKRAPSYFAMEQAHAHEVCADAYRELGEEARSSFHAEMGEALRGGPDTYTALISLAEMKIATCHFDTADAVLDRILELYKGNCRAAIDKGEIQLRKGNPKKAVEHARAGLSAANPKYLEEQLQGHLLLVHAYSSLEKSTKALSHARKAVGIKEQLETGQLP